MCMCVYLYIYIYIYIYIYPDAGKIMLLDDMNARVRKDNQTWNCLGLHEIGNTASNGFQFLQFYN